MKKTVNLFGIMRLIKNIGFLEIAPILGIPHDLAEKMVHDYEGRLHQDDLGGGWVHSYGISKYVPYDMTFQW